MFGFAALGFLLFCAILAVAVFFVFRSGDQGQTRLSGPAGCAVGCALLVIAGIGAALTTFVVVVNLPGEMIRRGPVERIELQYEDEGAHPGEEHAPVVTELARVRAVITLREGSDPAQILRVVRREVSHGVDVVVRTEAGAEGARPVIEIEIPLDREARRELREVLEELRREAPELELPRGIVIDIRDEDGG